MNLLFGFSGRIGRAKWWLGQLANLGVLIAGAIILATTVDPEQLRRQDFSGSAMLVLLAVVALAFWINAATTVKRFHDRDKSGFWFFIVLVPYIGGLWQIVECGFLSGSPGVNRYGWPAGTASFEDFEEEVRATYAPAQRAAPAAAASAAAPQRATSATRFAPSGFGRRGVS